jgi:hypothetical protein
MQAGQLMLRERRRTYAHWLGLKNACHTTEAEQAAADALLDPATKEEIEAKLARIMESKKTLARAMRYVTVRLGASSSEDHFT